MINYVKKNFHFQAERCAAHLRVVNINGKQPTVSVRTTPVEITLFGGEFTTTEYHKYLDTPKKLDAEKRKIIEKREKWLISHSQSSWYRFQIRLCACDMCGHPRKYSGVMDEILPQLIDHRNFLPTPHIDNDSDHFLPLSELFDRGEYYRPDLFLPENESAKIKPVLCLDCDMVCTSKKDFKKHHLLMHKVTTTTTTSTSTATSTTTATTSSIFDGGNISPHSSTPNSPKTVRKSALKRSREEAKSPQESSPKKKVCFKKKPIVESDSDEEVIHNDEDFISPAELDFFYGSTTFGRQVKELGDRKKRKESRRRSD